MRLHRIFILLYASLMFASISYAQEVDSLSLEVHFRWDDDVLDVTYMDNGRVLGDIRKTVDSIGVRHIDSMVIVSQSSPEGVWEHNQNLSRRRAATMRKYMQENYPSLMSLLTVNPDGESWGQLRNRIERDDNLTRAEKLRLIRIIDNDEISIGTKKWRMSRDPKFAYLYKTHYPKIRNSMICIIYSHKEHTDPIPRFAPVPTSISMEPMSIRHIPIVEEQEKPFYMALKTNMLYDAALVPNIGAEFYLGGRISINTNWMYAWWSNNSSNLFWRIYGGDIGLRAWLGRKAKMKPLTGHHLGAYISAFTYDFELGGRGYMGGEPGGDIFDRANYAAGVEYGYSLPIARRLNIDFSVGVGYMWGTYHEYLPIDDCYVWQVTKNRHYWGPIKAEVSLVWLIGRGNVNEKKGGRR